MDSLLALSTLALAFFTAWMAWSTRKLANESRESSFRQIGVQTWLEFSKRFDANEMLDARAKFVGHIQKHKDDPNHFKDISETVLNFFEDLGTAYHNECINKKLAQDSFSYYVTRYWELAKPYIEQERKIHNNDNSLFCEFQKLAAELDEEKDDDWKERFLNDEKLEAGQAIFELQHHSILLQQFENSFFQLMQMLNQIVSSMKGKRKEFSQAVFSYKQVEGRECFIGWYEMLHDNFTDDKLNKITGISKDNLPSDKKSINKEHEIPAKLYYEEFYKKHQDSLGHYFRVLYHAIKFVDSSKVLSTDEERKRYTSLVRAQLSAYELVLLFYNGISPKAVKFRPLIEKYGLLEHLDKTLLLNEAHKNFYSKAYK